MAVTVTIESPVAVDLGAGVDFTQSQEHVLGTLILSGDYGGASSDGDTLDFSGFDKIKSQQPPLWVRIWQEPTAGEPPVIYQFFYARGTTSANGLLQVTTANLVQISQGSAYPAALTDTDPSPNIRFEAAFPSFV